MNSPQRENLRLVDGQVLSLCQHAGFIKSNDVIPRFYRQTCACVLYAYLLSDPNCWYCCGAFFCPRVSLVDLIREKTSGDKGSEETFKDAEHHGLLFQNQ